MEEVVKEFVENNEKLNWKESLASFSKIFNKAKTNQQIDYWLVRGWTKEEAVEKISNQSKRASKKAVETIKKIKKDKKNWDKFNENKTTAITHYLNKGLTQEEAEEALKERQSTFSRKKLIEKHGEEEAEKILVVRNKKWIASIKENYDWDDLSKRKATTLKSMITKYGEEEGTERYYIWKKSSSPYQTFIKKYGPIEGKKKWIEHINNLSKISKESIKFFEPIIDTLKHYLEDDDIFIGYNDKKEYWLRYNNKKIFFFMISQSEV